MIVIEEPPQKNPQRRGRGQNPKYDQNIVRLNPQIDCNDQDNIMVPKEIEKKFLIANQPYYIVLNEKNCVSRCQGCEMEIPSGKGKWIL